MYKRQVYVSAALTHMHIKEEVKQTILETVKVVERLKIFERCLNDELEIAKLEKKISATVRRNIDKNQKEYFLREQLKACLLYTSVKTHSERRLRHRKGAARHHLHRRGG